MLGCVRFSYVGKHRLRPVFNDDLCAVRNDIGDGIALHFYRLDASHRSLDRCDIDAQVFNGIRQHQRFTVVQGRAAGVQGDPEIHPDIIISHRQLVISRQQLLRKSLIFIGNLARPGVAVPFGSIVDVVFAIFASRRIAHDPHEGSLVLNGQVILHAIDGIIAVFHARDVTLFKAFTTGVNLYTGWSIVVGCSDAGRP